MTGGQDALGIHSYSLEGYYGFSSRRANFLFSYVYDGLFPTLSLAYKDSVEYYRGSRNSLRTQELKLASLWPLRLRKRSQLYAYADLHLERRPLSSTNEADTMFPAASTASAWDWTSIRPANTTTRFRRRTAFASPSQGFIHPDGLGNEWASRGVQADLRGYIPLFRPGRAGLAPGRGRELGRGCQYYEMGGLRRKRAGEQPAFQAAARLRRGITSGATGAGSSTWNTACRCSRSKKRSCPPSAWTGST